MLSWIKRFVSNQCELTPTWKLERDIASNIRGLCGIIQLLLNFIKLKNSDPIALNESVKNVVVDSQINNLHAPLSNFVLLT